MYLRDGGPGQGPDGGGGNYRRKSPLARRGRGEGVGREGGGRQKSRGQDRDHMVKRDSQEKKPSGPTQDHGA